MRILSKIAAYFNKKETVDPMKYLIAGLGNMGREYDGTRHNVGFEIMDALAKEFNIEFKNEQLGDVGELRHKGRTFILLKPSTYMNRSGKSVRYWVQKKKILPPNLLVVVDDLNLPFGRMRLRGKGSHGGHNGLRDISEILQNDQFARLRIGIGDDFHKGRQVDYVLGKWSPEELEKLPEIIEKATSIVKSFGTIGIERTMSLFN